VAGLRGEGDSVAAEGVGQFDGRHMGAVSRGLETAVAGGGDGRERSFGF
jgi:hypothetical protein